MWLLFLALPHALAQDMQIIAHRGFSAGAPENTMAAFDAAAAAGVGFELDVTLSADEHVVVIHDDTVDRTTDASGEVSAHTLESLKRMDAGRWYSEDFEGEPVPTLREVLARWGGKVPIDIEIKTTEVKEPLALGVVRAIEVADLVDQVFVTSFDPFLLELVKQANPDIRRGQLTGTFKDADLSGIEKLVLRKMWMNGHSEPNIVAVEHVRINKRRLERWRRKGFEIYAWTVNDRADMERMVELGVDGVITDHPDLMAEVAGVQLTPVVIEEPTEDPPSEEGPSGSEEQPEGL